LPSIELPPNQVQLWTVIHHITDARYDELERHLTLDERVLRDTLGSERGQKFTTTRSMLRILLSRYTGIEPGKIRFRYGPRGKPFLVEKGREYDPRIQFNLSDSSDIVVFGFASDREIGVDIERVRHLERWRRIAERFFGNATAEELARLPDAERDRGFIARWVMEEARIKATGQGIWSRKSPEAASLSYRSFSPAPDYCGAVAALGTDWDICLCGPSA
jgi:4'-phosphopantetheinyl transferase